MAIVFAVFVMVLVVYIVVILEIVNHVWPKESSHHLDVVTVKLPAHVFVVMEKDV
jgi:hypothetical protein